MIPEFKISELQVPELQCSGETAAAHPRSKLRGIRGAAA